MICMICSTPRKLQHSSKGCNTLVWAGTTSSSGFFSHCVLTTLLTSFQGICVPEAEGEPDLVGRSPQNVPMLCSAESGCFAEEGPRSHCCGQDRLFRPPVVRRCHRGGGGGGGGSRTPPVMAVRRCPSPSLSLPWLLSTHPHQSAQFALGRALSLQYARGHSVSS